jgi:hypothetical protein
MSPETALAMDTFYIDTIKEKRPQKVKDDYLSGEPKVENVLQYKKTVWIKGRSIAIYCE